MQTVPPRLLGDLSKMYLGLDALGAGPCKLYIGLDVLGAVFTFYLRGTQQRLLMANPGSARLQD